MEVFPCSFFLITPQIMYINYKVKIWNIYIPSSTTAVLPKQAAQAQEYKFRSNKSLVKRYYTDFCITIGTFQRSGMTWQT